MGQTALEYQQVIDACKSLFLKKHADYGSAWRIMRLPSITDQIFIKAKRIRTLQEKGVQKVADDINGEFIGIINYCIMALIQSHLPTDTDIELTEQQVEYLYDNEVKKTRELLEAKNHDYSEAWRDMRVASMTDIMLMKIFRVKQIEDNSGTTLVSEGVDANYRDMLNYSVFCLINQGFLK